MTSFKKGLAWLLSITMLLGCMYIPALADDPDQTMAFTLNQLNESTSEVGTKASTLNAGKYFALTVSTNVTTLRAMQLAVEFDPDVVEYQGEFAKGDFAGYNPRTGAIISTGYAWGDTDADFDNQFEVGNPRSGIVKVTTVARDNLTLSGTTVLLYLPFRIKDTVENSSPDKLVWVSQAVNDVTKLSYNVGNTPVNHQFDTAAVSATATISGAPPTLAAKGKGELVLNGGSAVSLTVRGSNAQSSDTGDTLTVMSLKSKGGTTLTTDANVTYTVVKGAESTTALTGWTLTKDSDTVTIKANPNALAGNDYYVLATGKGTAVTGSIRSAAAFSVTREGSAAKTVTVSATEAGDVTLPAVGEDAATKTFAATVKDQFDTVMTDASVEWSLLDSPTGMSVNEGVVSVNSTAAVGGVTVVATSGGVSGNATFNIVKDLSAASIAIEGDSSITIDNTAAQQKSYTATVKDKYGTALETQPTVSWAFTDLDATGATLSATTGATVTLTVPAAANAGSVELKAYLGASADDATVYETKTVALNSLKFYANGSAQDELAKVITETTAGVTVATGLTYGVTWADIVNVEDATIVAKLEGDEVAGSLSVENSSGKPDATADGAYATTRILFNSNDKKQGSDEPLYKNVPVTTVQVQIAKADATLSAAIEGWTYGETAKTPTVTYNGETITTGYTTLYANKDTGTAEYSNAAAPANAGSYTLTVTVATSTNYNEATFTTSAFTIAPKTLTDGDIEITNPTYTGEKLDSIVIVVKDGTKTLVKDTDYTLSYSTEGKTGELSDGLPLKAGTYSAIVTGEGNYTGTPSVEFTVSAASITGATVAVTNDADLVYTGSALTPTVTVTLGSKELTAADYDLAYKKGSTSVNANAIIDAGTYTVTATGKGNYSGAKEATFTVAKADNTLTVVDTTVPFKIKGTIDLISDNKVSKGDANSSLTYSIKEAESQRYGITVDTNGVVHAPQEWPSALSTPEQQAAGVTVTVVVTAAENDNYNGVTKELQVKLQYKDPATVTFNSGTVTFNGDNQLWMAINNASVDLAEPGTNPTWTYYITVSEGNVTEVTFTNSNSDWVADETNKSGWPKNVGEYSVTVVYEDDTYKGETTGSFVITPLNLSGSAVVTLEIASTSDGTTTTEPVTASNVQYTGKEIKPIVTAKPNDAQNAVTLKSGTNYTIAYSNNTAVGTATVTLTFIGNYTGTKAVNFTINKAELSADDARVTVTGNYTYTGEAITPAVSVSVKGQTLAASEYTVAYEAKNEPDNNAALSDGKPLKAGAYVATVTLTDNSNYTLASALTAEFKVAPKSIANATLTLAASSAAYTGSAISLPALTVMDGATTLNAGTSGYTVKVTKDSAEEATIEDDGTYTVTVTGTKNYTGTARTTFEVTKKALTSEMIGLTLDSAELTSTPYTGSAIVPTVAVTDVTDLEEGEYTVAVTDNINVGTATVTVTATANSNYTGSATKTFTITAKNLSGLDDEAVSLAAEGLTYDGTEKKPAVTVTGLTEGKDYTVAYTNNTVAYTDDTFAASNAPTVTLTGVGNYTGTKAVKFLIAKAENPMAVTGSYTMKVSDSDPSTVNLNTLVSGAAGAVSFALPAGESDFSLSSGVLTAPATAKTVEIIVTAAGDENREEATGTITVSAVDKTEVAVTIGTLPAYTYTGAGQNVSTNLVTVAGASGGRITMTYAPDSGAGKVPGKLGANGLPLSAGDYTVIATYEDEAGNGHYGVSEPKAFTIAKMAASAATVTPATTSYEYSGTAYTPAVTVALGSTTIPATEYTVEYTGNQNAGTATINVSFKGNYSGSAEGNFTITPKDLSSIATMTLSADSVVWTGDPIKTPTPTVKLGGDTLASSNYDVAYSNNTAVGTATVTVSFKGNYSGSVSKTFAITAKAQTISDITATKTSLVGSDDYATVSVTGALGTMVFSSNNTAVAMVDSDGKVTAKSNGAATISVSAEATAGYAKSNTLTIVINVVTDSVSKITGITTVGGNDKLAAELSGHVITVSGVLAKDTTQITLGYLDQNGAAQTSALIDVATVSVEGQTLAEPQTVTLGGVAYTVKMDADNISAPPIKVVVEVEQPVKKVEASDAAAAERLEDNSAAVNQVAATVDATSLAAGTAKFAESFDEEDSAAGRALADAVSGSNDKIVEAGDDANWMKNEDTGAIDPEKFEVETQMSMGVTVQDYVPDGESSNSLKLDIEPTYKLVAKEKNGANELELTDPAPITEVSAPIEITITLPTGFKTDNLIAKHTHKGVVEYLPVTVGGTNGKPTATFASSKFSTFELIADSSTLTVDFKMSDDTLVATNVYRKTDVNTALPTVPNDGTIEFKGWSTTKNATTATYAKGSALTDAAFTSMYDAATPGDSTDRTLTLYAVMVDSNSGGTPSGGGSVAATVTTASGVTGGTLKYSSTNAKAGDTVVITPAAEKGYKLSSVVVKDSKGNTLAVTANADGTYSFTMPSGSVTVTPVFEKVAASKFTDVVAGSFYADAVEWAVANGITTGTTDTTFSPEESCTRAQAVTFLYRAVGEPEVTVSDTFADVEAGSYYEKAVAWAVAWAVANGITNGVSKTKFDPNATCTRAQIVTFLSRYEKASAVDSNKFTDVPAGEFYTGAVGWAVANGITKGVSETKFDPNATCTRAQIVTFLYRDFVK